MIIVRSYALVSASLEELRREGYGFSVLSEVPQSAPFELATYEEMFSDWGWSGDPSTRPKWMKSDAG